MNPSNDLFNLIKSLTPTEKKVFKMNFSNKTEEKEKKIYMALYDAIDRQTKYDEVKIKKQLDGTVDTRSFPVIKNYGIAN